MSSGAVVRFEVAESYASSLQESELQQARGDAAYVLRLRKAARSYFVRSSLSDPAWALLLSLYTSQEIRSSCIASVSKRAEVSRTTSLRWLKQLEHDGYVSFHPDHGDKRIVRVQLTPTGLEAMTLTSVAARSATG